MLTGRLIRGAAPWLGLCALLTACSGKSADATTDDTARDTARDTAQDTAPDWSEAIALEVRTVLTDPEGENIHSMVLSDGAMYVTTTSPPNHTSDDVARVTLTDAGGTVDRVAQNLPFPEGIDVGPDGALYTACWNDKAVHRVGTDGTDEVYSVGADNPTNVIFDEAGNLYISNWNTSTIDKVTPTGERSLFSDHPDYYGPHGMTFDDAGQLYVANFVDGKVFRVGADGEAEAFTQLTYGGYLGHLVWLDGSLYATAIELNQVVRITVGGEADGEMTAIAGSGLADDLDGAAMEAAFTEPNGLMADPDEHLLYVAMGSILKVITLGF